MKCRGFIIMACGAVLVAGAWTQAQPEKLWQASGPGDNIYYGGAVKDHLFYTGEINYGPMAWDPFGNIAASTNVGASGAKCAVPLDAYVFFTGDDGQGVYRVDDDWAADMVGPVNPNATAPESLATDGTYLYANDDVARGVIHKYAVSNGIGGFSLTEVWAATTGVSRIRGISVHAGALYVADTSGTDIMEIDAASGSSTNIITLPASGSYQVVRSGDRMFVVGTDGNLRVYDTDGTDWTAAGVHNLGMGALYSISDIDDGNFWASSTGSKMSYWSLRELPFTDDFESYPTNQAVADLAYNGWSGTPGAVVEAGAGVAGSQAAVLRGDSAVTNSVYPSVSLGKAWTDLYVKPVELDGTPPEVNTNLSAMLYVNPDGYVVVYDPDAAMWTVCSNAVGSGIGVAPIGEAYARLSLHKDYAAGKVAVFVNDVLVREGLSMIGDATEYRSMTVKNMGETNTCLDNLAISTNYPVDLTGDSDGDGWADALEIDTWGTISAATNGVPYTWLLDNGLTDPDGDADSDTLSNRQEYLAGTDPNDDASVFRILSIERIGTDTVITIMGNDSGADSDYIIENSTSLTNGFEAHATAVRGAAPGTTVYTDSEPPESDTIFYRVKAAW